MKSRDFVRSYLFTARWRHRLDRLRKQALYVAAKQWRSQILLIRVRIILR